MAIYLYIMYLQIGFPIEENFSSYSVIILPSFKIGSLCKSYVMTLAFQPAGSNCSTAKSNRSLLSGLN